MNSRQYTIRSIPPQLDSLLRKQVAESGKSLNEVSLEALKRGVGLSDNNTYDDLDHLFGVGIADQKSFDKSMKWLDALPSDLDENFKHDK